MLSEHVPNSIATMRQRLIDAIVHACHDVRSNPAALKAELLMTQ